MKTPLFLSLGVVAVAASACADVEPVAGDDTEYLAGLSEADVLAIHPMASDEFTADEWLAFNRAPFRCANYDDLCDVVGAEAAEAITLDALLLAVDGATRAEVELQLDRDIAAAEAEWSVPVRAGYRASETGGREFADGEHRVFVRVRKVKPVIGSRYGRTICKFETRLNDAADDPRWGTRDNAPHIVAYVEVRDSSLDESDTAEGTFKHTERTDKVFPGKNHTVLGRCTATHGGETRSVSRTVD